VKKRHITRQQYEAARAWLHQKDRERHEGFWAELRSAPNADAAQAVIQAYITGTVDLKEKAA
jgi:hypothetical protein